jgi:hypothetical protein
MDKKKNALGHLNTVKTSVWLWAPTKDVWPISTQEIFPFWCYPAQKKNDRERKTKAEGLKAEAKETCEEELPDNPPCAEEDEPMEDGWFCPQCSELPCQFLQWQEKLKRIVDCMNPDKSNKQKRFKLYRHVIRCRHGTLGKGNRKPLPSCFEQGMRDLYPSEKYTGYQTAYNSGPDDGSTPVYKLKK